MSRVPPATAKSETASVLAALAAALLLGGAAVSTRQQADEAVELPDWQINGYSGLDATAQAVFNALYNESFSVYDLHYYYYAPDWPTVEQLENYYIPPFYRDVSWEQTGELQWQLAAVSKDQGATVYYGGSGRIEGQGSFMLIMSHVHAGATYFNPSNIWWNPDVHAPVPDRFTKDSLIRHGWREVVAYSGRMELERIKGNGA